MASQVEKSITCFPDEENGFHFDIIANDKVIKCFYYEYLEYCEARENGS